MKLYGIKTCDTCRKALAALPAAAFVDVREAPVSDALLDRALTAFPDDLVNRRSTTWRALSEADRAEPARVLLRRHPTLMKRPLIETADGALHLGWSDALRDRLVR